jgi:GPH family glycoside/pentoside/hexuronide:cation symporter
LNTERLPQRLLLGWGVGSLGTAALLNALGTVQLFFFVSVLGMSGKSAGAIIFAAKIYDLLTDTPMGVLSDRSRSRWGRRVPWMFIGAILCGLAFWLIFNPPAVSGARLVAWQFLFLLLYASGYTLFNIPYIALAGEISDSPTERARLMSYRVGFMQAGIVLGAAGALLLVGVGGGGRAGYGFMGAIVAWLIAVPMLVATLTSLGVARNAPAQPRSGPAGLPMFRQIVDVLRVGPFRTLMIVKTLQMVGVAVVSASILFLMKSVLGFSEQDVAIKFGIASTAGTLLFIPVWFRIALHIGRPRAWFLATLLFVLVLLSFLLAGPGEPDLLIVVRAFVFGICTAGNLLAAQSLLTDTMQFDRLRAGEAREGVLSGVYSSVEKFAFAVGPLLVGVLLDAGGYDRAAATQSSASTAMIYFCVAVLPAICYLLSLPVLRGFRFDPATIQGDR